MEKSVEKAHIICNNNTAYKNKLTRLAVSYAQTSDMNILYDIKELLNDSSHKIKTFSIKVKGKTINDIILEINSTFIRSKIIEAAYYSMTNELKHLIVLELKLNATR